MLRSGVELRAASVADALDLLPRLREADRREVEAASGDVRAALVRAVETSLDPQALIKDGRIEVLYGVVAPDPFGDTAVPWALGSPAAGRLLAIHKSTVLDYLSAVRSTYPHLVNYVDARNRASVRWLGSLGFEVHPSAPIGVAGLPFHKFEIGHV